MKAVLLLAVLAAQCTPEPKPEPGPEPTAPIPPAPVDAGTGDRCERGAARATELGCPLPDVDGAPWVTVCRELEDRGIDMQPDCIERMSSCAGVQNCLEQHIRE